MHKYNVTVKRYIPTVSTYRLHAENVDEAKHKSLVYAQDDDFDSEFLQVVRCKQTSK